MDMAQPAMLGGISSESRDFFSSCLRTAFSRSNFGIGICARSSHDARMEIATVIARILLGLIFVVFGSNAFLRFLPMPPLPQGITGEYLHAFFASGYVYAIGGLQVIGGLLLLIGRFVPLGLTILGAIIVNIWLFHVLMAPEGLPPAVVITILELFLVWRYREAFAGIVHP
jgi:putative oxidoreductase